MHATATCKVKASYSYNANLRYLLAKYRCMHVTYNSRQSQRQLASYRQLLSTAIYSYKQLAKRTAIYRYVASYMHDGKSAQIEMHAELTVKLATV